MSDVLQTGLEMSVQSNLSTQYPFWCVMEIVKDYVGFEMEWEHRERATYDGMDEEHFKSTLCKQCKEKFEKSDFEDIPKECPTDSCYHSSYWYYNEVNQPNLNSGMYLTQKACQEHIDENDYHYRKARPYAYSAWRNPEMIAVMQHLIESAGQKVPSHYA